MVDRVADELHARRPRSPGEARLELQLVQEELGRRKRLPHLRQERAASPVPREHHAVDARAERGARALFGPVEDDGLERREDRDLDVELVDVVGREVLAARIVEGRGAALLATSAARLRRGLEAADAPLQLDRRASGA